MVDMHKILNDRLLSLKQEYQKGQQRLQQLDQERKAMYETMLRIAGAIQVLEEELNKQNGEEAPSAVITESELAEN